jgi:hypothetical protein
MKGVRMTTFLASGVPGVQPSEWQDYHATASSPLDALAGFGVR